MRCEQSQDTIEKPSLLLEQQDGKRFALQVVLAGSSSGILTAVVFGNGSGHLGDSTGHPNGDRECGIDAV